MGEKKILIEKTLDVKQIAAFLRLLAAELEGNGCESNEFGSQLHGFNKLKLGVIRQEGGQLLLTLKVKSNGNEAQASDVEFTDTAAHDYRPFKQRLKSTFTELSNCVNQATLPSEELLARFKAESKQLISFPGFGDPWYDEYWQACLGLEQAVKVGSVPAFHEKWAAVSAIKKACHRRFK